LAPHDAIAATETVAVISEVVFADGFE